MNSCQPGRGPYTSKLILTKSMTFSVMKYVGSSWKGSEGIESSRQICTLSTSEIKAGNVQFDHEKNTLNKGRRWLDQIRHVLKFTFFTIIYMVKHESNHYRLRHLCPIHQIVHHTKQYVSWSDSSLLTSRRLWVLIGTKDRSGKDGRLHQLKALFLLES